MGHNFSGIAINKNFENNTEELSKLLGLELQLDEEIDFEQASENWKDEGYFDVYFSKNGTLVFANIDYCLEPYWQKETNILTFALSETSMTFNISYTENIELVRSIMKVNDDVLEEEGELLQCEIDNEEDITEAIFDQIGEIIGIHFSEIELDDKAYRFTLKSATSLIEQEQKPIVEEPANTTFKTKEINKVPQNKFNAKTNNSEITNNTIGIEFMFAIVLILALLVGLIYVIIAVINLP